MEQSPAALSLQEGVSHVLRCNFSASVSDVHWYLKNPSGRLIHLFSVPSGTKQEGRLKATTVPAECRSSLHIFLFADHRRGHLLLCCAARCSPGTCGLYTNPPGAQPLLQPQSHRGPHRAFAVLIVSCLHWYSFNHRHFPATDYELRSLSSFLNLYLLLH